MATVNGAKALNLQEKTGVIEKGKCADLIILNLDTATTKPINNIFSEIVYNVKGTNVETTIINGKIVMENRIIENIDVNKLFNKCEKIINRIK